jgi:polyhydroxyalkanoate synthase
VTVYRYRNSDVRHRPPLLLFIGLMSRPYFLDLYPGNSFVERLLAEGFDVYLLDWGVAGESEGDHTLATYVDSYMPRAVDSVLEASGASAITMLGYCMGAFLAVLALGSRTDLPVANLVLLTPLVDLHEIPPAAEPLRDGLITPESLIDETTNLVPVGVIKSFFRLRKPTADLVQYVNLWDNLWREGYSEGHQAMAQWVWDHVPFAGPAFIELVREYVQANALMTGSARVAGRPVRLDSITMPTLIVTAERDELVPPACSAPLAGMLGAADLEAHVIPAGHIGLIMGRSGAKVSIPLMIDWLTRHSTDKEG